MRTLLEQGHAGTPTDQRSLFATLEDCGERVAKLQRLVVELGMELAAFDILPCSERRIDR